MGGLALTRENALVFILVILGVDHQRRGWGARGWGPAVRSAGLFLAGLRSCCCLWRRATAYVGGGFFVTTSQFGPNFYIGNNAGRRRHIPVAALRSRRARVRAPGRDGARRARARQPAHAGSRSRATGPDKALDFVVSKPGAWLALMGRKVVAALERHRDARHREPGGACGMVVAASPRQGSSDTSACWSRWRSFGVFVTWPMRSRLWILYAMTLAYAASVVVFYVFARYRYPARAAADAVRGGGVVAIPALDRVAAAARRRVGARRQ